MPAEAHGVGPTAPSTHDRHFGHAGPRAWASRDRHRRHRRGATAVQLRAPELSDSELLPIAGELAERCAAAGVLFIVNDRLDVALASGADGRTWASRTTWPGPAIGWEPTGRSASASRMPPKQGPQWGWEPTTWESRCGKTPTKPEATGRGPAGVGDIHRAVPIPVVGIGGINDQNLGEVFDAGASGIAVISAIAGAAEPVAATRRLRALIDLREAGARGATNR